MQNNKVHGVSQSTYTKLAVAHLKVTPACQTQVDGANNRSLSKGNLQPDASGSPQSQGVSLSLYLSLCFPSTSAALQIPRIHLKFYNHSTPLLTNLASSQSWLALQAGQVKVFEKIDKERLSALHDCNNSLQS